jgi:hypothetical protein
MVLALTNGPGLKFQVIAFLTSGLTLAEIGMVRTLPLWSTTFDISRVIFLA